MTTRRHFLIAGALSALGVPYTAAQGRVPLIGMLAPFQITILAPQILQRLAELGYREAGGMRLEYRSTDGVDSRYPKLARELIAAKCDVIFALGDPAAQAFHDARTPVPVVFILPDTDPLEKGYVDSLGRPSGNMTGVYVPAAALAAKRLEMAQEALPSATRFLVLVDAYSKDQLGALRKAAEGRRARLTVVEFAQRPSDRDFEAAFATGRRAGVEAMIGLNSPNFATSRAKLVELIASEKLPAFVSVASWAEDPGVLVGYGTSSANFAARTAELGVRILKGAKPADIPVEQPSVYELTVNLKTARALGVKVPYSVLTRATLVIE